MEGWSVHPKRVQRIWRREGLQVSQKQLKRARLWLNDGSYVHPDPVWTYDFLHHRTHDGHPVRLRSMVAEYTRESLAIEVARPLHRGVPSYIRSDHGTEFTAEAVRDGLGLLDVRPLFIQPGSPWRMATSRSCNGKLCKELLDREIFYPLQDTQILIEPWRRQYNRMRPHSSRGYRKGQKDVPMKRSRFGAVCSTVLCRRVSRYGLTWKDTDSHR